MRILKVKTSGTLKNVFRDMGVPKTNWEDLALVNGKKLNDKVKKGALLKVVKNK